MGFWQMLAWVVACSGQRVSDGCWLFLSMDEWWLLQMMALSLSRDERWLLVGTEGKETCGRWEACGSTVFERGIDILI